VQRDGKDQCVRAGANFGIFLVVQAVYVAVLAALVRAPLGIGVTILVVAGALTLPMLPIYLVVVARFPSRWPPRRQRLAAVVASPLLLSLFAIVLGVWMAPTGLFLLLVGVPGTVAYGALVRLPRANRSVVNA